MWKDGAQLLPLWGWAPRVTWRVEGVCCKVRIFCVVSCKTALSVGCGYISLFFKHDGVFRV